MTKLREEQLSGAKGFSTPLPTPGRVTGPPLPAGFHFDDLTRLPGVGESFIDQQASYGISEKFFVQVFPQ
jgi:hypothetical protein